MGLFNWKNSNESAYVGGQKHWVDVIKNSGDKPVTGNFCCGSEYNEEETLEEVNFLTAYLLKFLNILGLIDEILKNICIYQNFFRILQKIQ